MKKEHIADAVLVETGGKLSKKEATAAVNTVLETIAKGIKQEGLVKIAGFGTFRRSLSPCKRKRYRKSSQTVLLPDGLSERSRSLLTEESVKMNCHANQTRK